MPRPAAVRAFEKNTEIRYEYAVDDIRNIKNTNQIVAGLDALKMFGFVMMAVDGEVERVNKIGVFTRSKSVLTNNYRYDKKYDRIHGVPGSEQGGI